MGVERLEVAVQVDVLVRRVGEPVQALARAGVGAGGSDPEFVVRGEAGECDPVTAEAGEVDRCARSA